MAVMPVGTVEVAGTGTPSVWLNCHLASGSLARCSTMKRSMAPSFHMPCWGPQSWVMSLVVWPATLGGLLTSSNGSSTVAPSASEYDTFWPPRLVPTIGWAAVEATLEEGPPGYEV